MLLQRHQLVDQLGALARELTAGLTDLAEDDSWARGQAEAMRAPGRDDGSSALSVRSVRATQELLAQTRRQQRRLKGERDRARDALQDAGRRAWSVELGELAAATGRFGEQLGRYADRASSRPTRSRAWPRWCARWCSRAAAVQAEVADASARLQAGQAACRDAVAAGARTRRRTAPACPRRSRSMR